MHKRYFRMKDPKCKPEEIEWIEMTGREFYQFVSSPEGQGRHFIDMDNVVLEGSSSEAHAYRAEKDHSDYLKEQEKGWITLSLYTDYGYSGEDVIRDEAQDVEAEVISCVEKETLHTALTCLDAESSSLINALYFAKKPKTERELALELGLSQNAVNKRKQKILKTLKILVVKIEKSSQ